MEQNFDNAETFVDQVKEYVNTRLAQLKLSFAEKTSKVVAIMIAVVMVALVFFLFLVLLCIAGSLAMNQWLESSWLGFLIMAGIVLLAGFILWISRDRMIRRPIMNAMINAMFDKDEDEKN